MAIFTETRHPHYLAESTDWKRWRDVYEGGSNFIRDYLEKLSALESDEDFASRKNMSFCPGFASAAIDDVKNSIFQRIADVARTGGAPSYQKAITGEDGGVDYCSSSLGVYMGEQIIPELLLMRRVGVLTDNFDNLGQTFRDKGTKHPYLTTYTTEQILSWSPLVPVNGFDKLLLQEERIVNEDSGLPSGVETFYRYMEKTEEGVWVKLYKQDQENPEKTFLLNLEKIPFTVFSIKRSLMQNLDRYQIALLNIESSDISYIRRMNFPFYYEFFDKKTDGPFQKPHGDGATGENKSKEKEIKIGAGHGRRFPEGTTPPGFINPSPETLEASMDKQEQMKKDMRSLLNLNLSSLDPRRQSAESRSMDDRSLEAGLSAIGLELQRGEQQIAETWSDFESSNKAVRVTYPKRYDLKSDKERREEAKEIHELSTRIPSEKFKKIMGQRSVDVLLQGNVTDEELQEIKKEIENSEYSITDPNLIMSANKQGLVDDITSSNALGFNGEEVVPKAMRS